MRFRFAFSLMCMANVYAALAQEGLLRQADRLYTNYSYHDAIADYEQAFRKNASSIEHARKLAD